MTSLNVFVSTVTGVVPSKGVFGMSSAHTENATIAPSTKYNL
jgi:hypothetical protein